MESRLTEWQKVEALNLFVVSYHLGATTINCIWAAKTDSLLRKLLKKCEAAQEDYLHLLSHQHFPWRSGTQVCGGHVGHHLCLPTLPLPHQPRQAGE